MYHTFVQHHFCQFLKTKGILDLPTNSDFWYLVYLLDDNYFRVQNPSQIVCFWPKRSKHVGEKRQQKIGDQRKMFDSAHLGCF